MFHFSSKLVRLGVALSNGVTMPEMTLAAAMAWVYSRDIGFVTYVDSRSYRPLEDAFVAYDAAKERHFYPACTGWPETWRLLREVIATKGLELRGAAFSMNEKQRFITFEGYRYMTPPPSIIPTALVPRLYFEDGDDGAVLRFLGDQETQEKRWRHVQMESGAIFEAFPDVSLKRRLPRNAARSVNKHSPANQLIAEAVSALWPDGKIERRPTVRDRTILEWADNNGHGTQGLSKSSLGRYFAARKSDQK